MSDAGDEKKPKCAACGSDDETKLHPFRPGLDRIPERTRADQPPPSPRLELRRDRVFLCEACIALVAKGRTLRATEHDQMRSSHVMAAGFWAQRRWKIDVARRLYGNLGRPTESACACITWPCPCVCHGPPPLEQGEKKK